MWPRDLMDALTAEYGPCGLNAERLQQRAAQLYAPPDPLADERLQMMTIHKSGLEFDVVIVPGVERVIGGQDPSLLIWDEVAGDDGQTRPTCRTDAAGRPSRRMGQRLLSVITAICASRAYAQPT